MSNVPAEGYVLLCLSHPNGVFGVMLRHDEADAVAKSLTKGSECEYVTLPIYDIRQFDMPVIEAPERGTGGYL